MKHRIFDPFPPVTHRYNGMQRISHRLSCQLRGFPKTIHISYNFLHTLLRDRLGFSWILIDIIILFDAKAFYLHIAAFLLQQSGWPGEKPFARCSQGAVLYRLGSFAHRTADELVLCAQMRAPLSLHLTVSAILVGWQYTEESYQHSNHAVLTDSKMLETIILELLPRRDKCDEQMTCTYNWAEKHSMLHRFPFQIHLRLDVGFKISITTYHN